MSENTPTSSLGELSTEYLEELSDKVRKGEPISFLEALAVVDYQEGLRLKREENSLRTKVKRWFTRVTSQLRILLFFWKKY